MKKLKQMTQFSDLPSCLVMDILSRLPITILLTTCRWVCKDWIRWLNEPLFIQLQRIASPVHILNRIVSKGEIFELGQFMEDKPDGDLQVKILKLRIKDKLPSLPSPQQRDYFCHNSCNGLLCLVGRDYICVCNPVLGQCVSISRPVKKHLYLSNSIRLVFSGKNNQYKLLHGFKTDDWVVENGGYNGNYGFEIYTLGGGTRQWRSIHETLGCIPPVGRKEFNTVFNGSLHWTNRPDFVFCFDADNEKFRRLSLPRPSGCAMPRQRKSSSSTHSYYMHLQLGVINGCLSVLFFWGNKQARPMEIWSMKEYGVEESWAMTHTFHVSSLLEPTLLFSLKEEEILMSDYKEGLISYNVKMERCRRLPPCRKNKTFFRDFEVAYKPSFVSLQDVAKGEQARTMEII